MSNATRLSAMSRSLSAAARSEMNCMSGIVAPRSYTIQNLWLGSLLGDSMEAINTLIDALRTANHDARTDIKAEIIALAKGDDGSAVRAP